MKTLREMTDAEFEASARAKVQAVRENPATEAELEEAEELERRMDRFHRERETQVRVALYAILRR